MRLASVVAGRAMRDCAGKTWNSLPNYVSAFRRHQTVDVRVRHMRHWILNYVLHVYFSLYRRAMGRAVSRLLVTAAGRVRSPCELCVVESGCYCRGFLRILRFSFVSFLPNIHIQYIHQSPKQYNFSI